MALNLRGSPVGSTLLDMSLPDWIIAITGVGSAAGTVGAFAVSYRLLHREARRDAERDKRLRREDASYVNAWVERDLDLDPHSDVLPPTALQFVVRNDGHTPVYNVTLLVPDFYEPDGCLVQTNFDAGMLVPGQMHIQPAPTQMSPNFAAPSPFPIVFTDSSGVTWWRDGAGRLAEYGGNPEELDIGDFLVSWETAPEVKAQA